MEMLNVTWYNQLRERIHLKKVQTKITSGSTEISDTYTLTEGASETSVSIKERYLSKKSIMVRI
ncbi:hypothetical protein [Vallitalea guaymasensis]|uniref:hypothetical protein n=1 Tax=Vallitalea guaymasensis TaxID=1185412 RepID=UPI00272DB49F|nr:hypothetical protein [Vallitalea guaymasensis]